MAEEPKRDDELSDSEPAEFRRLLEMLNAEHRFDFREYKPVSLLRRIRARMSQLRVEGFDAYVDYLRMHPPEATVLFNSILVNVTGFFRDPDAWDSFRAEALPELVPAAASIGRLRVWSAGCATGEEAYSAAIVIADALGPRAADIDVKIYATDIDDEALVAARHAIFRPEQLKDVPSDMLDRYFTADGHVLRVRRELRRWCIFGRHNLAQDPPLPQIDLLLCRNVLIYFKTPLQERLLTRFHYALREGGVLFLGRSESLMGGSRGFLPISQKWRLFRRAADPSPRPDRGALQDDILQVAERGTPPAPPQAPRVTAGAVVRALPYAVMLIDLDDSVREWNEAASALYEIPAEHAVGRQFRDLDISYRAEGLRARIEEVKRTVVSVRLENVLFTRRSGETVHLDVWVSRVFDDRSRSAAIVVAAVDSTAVARLREEIVRLGEQHATATEELQSTNKELETINEELQSTNEDLETTNEELQSTNEELITTVDELQATNTELATRSSELRRVVMSHAAVMDSVSEPVVVLDRSFAVTAWNRAAERFFGVRAGAAIDREFFALALGADVETLRAAATTLAKSGASSDRQEVEFQGTVVRLVRLADGDDAFQGVVLFARAS